MNLINLGKLWSFISSSDFSPHNLLPKSHFKDSIPFYWEDCISYIYSSKYRTRKASLNPPSNLLTACSSVPKSSWGSAFFPAWHQEFQYLSRGKWSTTQLWPRFREYNRITEAMQTYRSQIAKPIPPAANFLCHKYAIRTQSIIKVNYMSQPFFLRTNDILTLLWSLSALDRFNLDLLV